MNKNLKNIKKTKNINSLNIVSVRILIKKNYLMIITLYNIIKLKLRKNLYNTYQNHIKKVKYYIYLIK